MLASVCFASLVICFLSVDSYRMVSMQVQSKSAQTGGESIDHDTILVPHGCADVLSSFFSLVLVVSSKSILFFFSADFLSDQLSNARKRVRGGLLGQDQSRQRQRRCKCTRDTDSRAIASNARAIDSTSTITVTAQSRCVFHSGFHEGVRRGF